MCIFVSTNGNALLFKFIFNIIDYFLSKTICMYTEITPYAGTTTALIAGGIKAIVFVGIQKTLTFMVVSPIAGFVIAFG